MRALASKVKTTVQSMLSDKIPFEKLPFPTSIKYLYLRSSDNPNRVCAVGYRYLSPTKIQYTTAKCKNNRQVKDIFSKKIARAIINGRMEAGYGNIMQIPDRSSLYSIMIMCFHPDSKKRKLERKLSLLNVFEIGD